ncbi:MAG: dihydrodipicolinate synthase family protein [Rhodopila sp.]|nr:dihydrodipicolinate synthase family protein [Rhodopila sp.]
MTDTISGLWAAAATPVAPDGSIDHAALADHAQRLIARGCDGLVLFGTSGEGPSFSIAQRLEATEAVLRSGVPAGKLALGTGCPAVVDTIAMTRASLGLGITRAMILPPFYFAGAPDEGIEDAFAEVIDGVADDRLSACLYHIPQVSGVGVPAAVLGRLRTRYGATVSGVKDSTGDFDSFLAFRREAPDAAVLVGAEVLIAKALAQGGAGTICGMANLVPGLVRRMFDGPEAEPDMQEACAQIDGIPMMKAVLAAMTEEPVWRRVRPPLRAADEAAARRAAEVLSQLEG